jgi:hypothetical protein
MLTFYEISEFSKKSLKNPFDNNGGVSDDIYHTMSSLYDKIKKTLREEVSNSDGKVEKIVDDGLIFVALPEFIFTKVADIANTSNYKKGKDEEIRKINPYWRRNEAKVFLGWLSVRHFLKPRLYITQIPHRTYAMLHIFASVIIKTLVVEFRSSVR